MSGEDLAARVQRLRAATARTRERTVETVRFVRFVWQVSRGIDWAWERVGYPIAHVVWRGTRFAGHGYRRGWDRIVHRRTPAGPEFSRTRAGMTVLGTVLIGWYVALPMLELLTWDAPLYALTARVDEVVYLNGSQQLDTLGGGHAIEGCERTPCSDLDALYYVTDNSWFNNLWSLWHGRGLFFPEYVGAAVPYQTSRCVITSYGFRFRLSVRFLNVYPHLLAVSCGGENR